MTTPTSPTAAAPAAGSVTVRIPGPLRDLTGGAAELVVPAGTVRTVLEDVLSRHPALRRHLRTESGALREHVNIFRNEDDIRFLEGEGTRVEVGDVVMIVPSIAGG